MKILFRVFVMSHRRLEGAMLPDKDPKQQPAHDSEDFASGSVAQALAAFMIGIGIVNFLAPFNSSEL
jgi:hypothetical protein